MNRTAFVDEKKDVARRRKLGHVVLDMDLDSAFAAYRKKAPFKGNLGRRKITLQVVHRAKGGTRGTAFVKERRMRVAIGPDATQGRVLAVLVHEMVHLACSLGEHHGEHFRRIFKRACLEIWGIDVPLDAYPRMGVIAYGMCDVAAAKLEVLIALEEIDTFPPKLEPKRPTRAELMEHVVAERAEHAEHMLKRARRRARLAETSVARWQKKVAYYRRRAEQKAAKS